MSGLNILIIGAGMYVCGKGTNGHGTILPTIVQLAKKGEIEKIFVCATSQESGVILESKLNEINSILGSKVEVFFSPKSGKDEKAYLDVLDANRIDCAILSTPDHTHFRIANEIIKRKIHLLVVKPLTPTLQESKELTKLALENNCYGAVEFHKRYDRSNLKLRESIQSGKIGKPVYFVVEYSQRISVPTVVFKTWAKDTNIFQYLGVHYVDIIYFCTGAIPLKVSSLGHKSKLKNDFGLDTYDSVICNILWKNTDGSTFSSVLHTNWIDPEQTSSMSDQRIKVIGTDGRFEADQKYRGLLSVTQEDGIEETNPDFCQIYTHFDGSKEWRGYGIESIEQFINDVNNLKLRRVSLKYLNENRPSFGDALVSTAVVEASNKSLENNGDWIEIDEGLLNE